MLVFQTHARSVAINKKSPFSPIEKGLLAILKIAFLLNVLLLMKTRGAAKS